MDDADKLYWQKHLERQPFYVDGLDFGDFAPALRMGHAHFRDDTLFDDVQCRLGGEWEAIKGPSRLAWFEARHAVRAAWERSAELVLGPSPRGNHLTSADAGMKRAVEFRPESQQLP